MIDMEELKKTYVRMKNQGDQQRIDFLDSVAAYCDFLSFTHDKKITFLAMLRNVLPLPGKSIESCDNYDEVDIQFNKKMLNKITQSYPTTPSEK